MIRKIKTAAVLFLALILISSCGSYPAEQPVSDTGQSKQSASSEKSSVTAPVSAPESGTDVSAQSSVSSEDSEISAQESAPSPDGSGRDNDSVSEESSSEQSVPKEETAEETVRQIVSEQMNFSFTCTGSFEAETASDGQITLFLSSKKDSASVVCVGRLAGGTDAKSCLEQKIAAEKEKAGSDSESDSETPELLEISGRDIYRASFSYAEEDTERTFICYTEDYLDESVMYYSALYENGLENTAQAVLSEAIDTIWVGELTAPESMPAPSDKTVAGNWTFTQSTLENGDIEFCFDDELVLILPGSWMDDVFWFAETDRFCFYQRESYNLYAREGKKGGLLFAIARYPDESYYSLPSWQYLGKAGNGGHYIMVFATDEQVYEGDAEILQNWEKLFGEITYVLDHSYSMVFE